jgi:hypothetical protein
MAPASSRAGRVTRSYERDSHARPRKRSRLSDRPGVPLALLALTGIAAVAGHLAFTNPAWSFATPGVFSMAVAGIVACAVKMLDVGESLAGPGRDQLHLSE